MAERRDCERPRVRPASVCRDVQADPLDCHARGWLLAVLKSSPEGGPSCLDIYSRDVQGQERLHPPVMRANELLHWPGWTDPGCSGTSLSIACVRSECRRHVRPFVQPSVSARG